MISTDAPLAPSQPASSRIRRTLPLQGAADRGRCLRAVCALTLTLLASATTTGLARAQMPTTLGELVVEWARGVWASPIYCHVDGETVRAVRRVVIQPTRDPGPGRPSLEVLFVDMEPGQASRCFDVLGHDIPNLVGRVQLRFNSNTLPETRLRDFERAMKRDRGFEFATAGGRLQATPVALPPKQPESMELRKASVWLRDPARGSDEARALADFGTRRKLSVEIDLAQGGTISVPLFLLEPR